MLQSREFAKATLNAHLIHTWIFIVIPELLQRSTPVSAIFSSDGVQNNEKLSILNKEVVDRLVKQWAPVVWLAPEENFMPLAVDEFLQNVHAVEKDNFTVRGKAYHAQREVGAIPVGDKSLKAYLVTNLEMDELLQNQKSFIFGKNPNEHSVPVYAVVTLCDTKTHPPPNDEIEIFPKQQFVRAPYIPVSIESSTERNRTVLRSLSLDRFPRKRRHVQQLTPSTDHLSRLTDVRNEDNIVNSVLSQQTETDNNHASEFIANLSDNVKFSETNGEINSDVILQNTQNKRIIPSFHVTYWMFYPYSQGKSMCTISLGLLGSIPFPALYGFCLGHRKDIGNHIGDWEHMSLYFNGLPEPETMYVSAHDAGAFYSYNDLTGSFEFKKQETRKGILQRPNFPKTVTTFTNHPVLFAAKGSHGLWTAPGKHKFVKVPRLYDVNGFGTPWKTWKSIQITYENKRLAGGYLTPVWLAFKGKWGNPKSKCHPFKRIGLNFCEYIDGPTGIPLKEPHFQCRVSY